MATKKDTTPAPTVKPPADYHRSDSTIDGWWSAEDGPVHGVLIGAITFLNRRRNTPQTAYLLKLLEPTVAMVRTTNGELAKDTLRKGEICAVFQTGALKRPLANLQGAAVWLQRITKRELPDGNSMWEYQIFSKGKGAPLNIQSLSPERSNNAEDGDADDMPF